MDKRHVCRKNLNEECGLDPLHDWFKVMYYLELELTQGNITKETWEVLTNAMMSIRPEEG